MARMGIIFDGFKDLAYQIDKAGGNLREAVNDALTETQHLVQVNLEMAAAPYAGKGLKGYATGELYEAIIKDVRIYWTGGIAEVGVGFTSNGGQTIAGFMHSIFIMYGTPRHEPNNRGITADKKIYDAIRGSRTKKEIAELQQEVMSKYLKLGG